MNISYLSVSSPVLLQVNLKPEVGLCNGLQGRICDFKFDENNVCSEDISIASSICVWVEFNGYTGKTFFPHDESRRHWVPIFPVQKDNSVITRSDGFKLLSRTMIPLRLSWAITIHKAQGQTIPGNVVVRLGDSENTLGLSYVAFSRVTKLQNIGVDGGGPSDRLMKKISCFPSLKKRLAADKRLEELAHKTLQILRVHMKPERNNIVRNQIGASSLAPNFILPS